MDKGFCPTQARVLFLFDQLPCKFHICYLENLFMLTNICRTVYVDLKAKVKIHGVTIAKDLGLPIFFIKQEDTEKLKKARSIRTIKQVYLKETHIFQDLSIAQFIIRSPFIF